MKQFCMARLSLAFAADLLSKTLLTEGHGGSSMANCVHEE